MKGSKKEPKKTSNHTSALEDNAEEFINDKVTPKTAITKHAAKVVGNMEKVPQYRLAQ